MKRIVTLLMLMTITVALFAQRGKVTSALSYKDAGNFEKAYEAISEATDPNNEKAEKTIDWPRAWQAKGQILMEMYRKGEKGIAEKPLFEAHDALKHCKKLDDKGRLDRQLKMDFAFLQTDLSNYAIMSFENKNFDDALESFERYMEISNIDIINETGQEIVDTAIIYNSGLSAYRAENWEKALKYFTRSAKLGYNGPTSYRFAYEINQTLGDTLKSINILKEGFEKYPDDEVLIVELINFYINANDANAAFEYLDMAIEKNPENVSYYTAKGNTLEKLDREDEAIEIYNEAIKIDPEIFTPYYNLGVIYFNRGVNMLNEASQLPPNETEAYNKTMELGKDELKKALPFFEKAHELEPSDFSVMESLKLIYYRLQMTDKYKEMNEKTQNVSQ